MALQLRYNFKQFFLKMMNELVANLTCYEKAGLSKIHEQTITFSVKIGGLMYLS